MLITVDSLNFTGAREAAPYTESEIYLGVSRAAHMRSFAAGFQREVLIAASWNVAISYPLEEISGAEKVAAFRSSPAHAAHRPTPWPRTVAICLTGLVSSGVAATCAAYYIAEPAVYRPPAITGDSLGTHAKARSHNSSPKKAVDRPVRLADSDAWIDSLRSNAYWKQRSSGTSGSSGSGETSRSNFATAVPERTRAT